MLVSLEIELANATFPDYAFTRAIVSLRRHADNIGMPSRLDYYLLSEL
jgi:hypothetical protein